MVDEFTREGLAVRVSRSMTSGDVVRVLAELMRRHGKPMCLRSDNGPEFIARTVQDRALAGLALLGEEGAHVVGARGMS